MEYVLGILQVLGIFIVFPAIVGFSIVGSVVLMERLKVKSRTKEHMYTPEPTPSAS